MLADARRCVLSANLDIITHGKEDRPEAGVVMTFNSRLNRPGFPGDTIV
jgi:hypothetical protein